jgi:NTE family protein
MPTAFVLQGGGSLAAVQVGMLRALLEAGIAPDMIVGSSAGAINAVAFAQDPTDNGLARLERLWVGLRRATVFPLSPRDIVTGLVGRRDGLASPRRLRALLARTLETELLEDAPIPVHVVATDAASGQAVTLSRGRALDALLASGAMPGVFPPVPLDGLLLTDGGVAADIPILQAEALGATESYILPCVLPAEPDSTRGAVAFLLRALSQIFDRATATDLSAAQGQVHLLPAPRQAATNPFDFRHTESLIAEGYRAARTALTSAAVTSAAVTSAAVTNAAVTSAAVTNAAVTGAAVTSAALANAAAPISQVVAPKHVSLA